MNTEHVNHDPASKFLHTGFQLAGRPSAGAWVSYALGSDNRDLPNFVVMNSGMLAGVPHDAAIWGPGFLPSHHQGVEFRAADDPVLYVNNPRGHRPRRTAARCSTRSRSSRALQHAESNDPEILSRVSQYEMAYRMQSSVPEVADISDEPESRARRCTAPTCTKPGTFARNCLLARRLAERGVKYKTLFQLGLGSSPRDQAELPAALRRDRPAGGGARHGPEAARPARRHARDVRQRVRPHAVRAGPDRQPAVGRDHHGGCFTWWLAGGGVKAGYTHGETDDFSYNIVKDPVHIHDLNATMLHIARHRPRAADVPLPGPRLPADRRPWQGRARDPGVTSGQLTMQEFVFFLGRFHVLALHLPIGIVIAAVVLDWLARRPRYARARERRAAALGLGRDLGRADGRARLPALRRRRRSRGRRRRRIGSGARSRPSPPSPAGGSRAQRPAARAPCGSRPASRCSRSCRSRATTAAT